MSNVIDQSVREEVLNPVESYIVQAPAGSGKTELLTQRILALLAAVEKPENILAITFTRKAAAEMRSRVVSALTLAQGPEPEAPHERFRWKMAKKVLKRDKEKNWHLVENASRLNVTTIDSLSASLSAALPLLSQTGALPAIAENAFKYYREAADNLLASISNGDKTAEDIKQLLKHKDNNLNLVSELIAQMLGKRLQWLAQIGAHGRRFNQQLLARSLDVVVRNTLKNIYDIIPVDVLSELPALLNQASAVLRNSEKVTKHYLCDLQPVDAIVRPDWLDKKTCISANYEESDFFEHEVELAEELYLWKAIAELFLKASGKGEILSRFNVKNGFPPEKNAKDEIEKQQFKQNKKRVDEIAKCLKAHSGVGSLLYQVTILPDRYNFVHTEQDGFDSEPLSHEQSDKEQTYQSLNSAIALLPVALAHLKIVFSRHNVIDFSELALASLEALGHEDMPSDLALALDYKLEHILIDEFQDTSTPQIELIKLLTAGWERDSGRTLFLVGDPMQSIYRFRDANVSLFMRIRNRGIGIIKPKFRQLKVNFRSHKTIVDWVNRQFSQIMPEEEDLTFSAVSYADSVAFNQSSKSAQVESFFTVDADNNIAQANKVIEIVQSHLDENRQLEKKKTLAILARSRTNFTEIIELLNQNNIDFEAVEIDRLSQKIIVSDLTSLAFALCDQFDELSWAACMRSPWFGLDLQDIKQVFTETEQGMSIPERIVRAMPMMSKGSRARCEKILPILQSTIRFKGRKPFRKWLLGCFVALGGLSQLDYQSERDDLLVCLDKLSELSEGGELNDRQLVIEAIEQLFAASSPAADGQVQVMTIHKSKGLEFDTVILPRLDSGKKMADQVLLKWTQVLDEEGNGHNLIAISKETGRENDSVYRYISYLDNEKSKYEDQRVLYVAATRAKQNLYLLGNVKTDSKSGSPSEPAYKPATSLSYLAMLWQGVKDDFKIINGFEGKNINSKLADSVQIEQEKSESVDSFYESRMIKQVNISRTAQMPQQTIPDELPAGEAIAGAQEELGQAISDGASTIGTVLHRQLQWVSEHWHDAFELPQNWAQVTSAQLRQLHWFSDDELDDAVSKILYGLKETLNDDFGRFVLSAKEEAESELILHKKLEHGNYLTRIIDRTFVDSGVRWIIDYKSSQPEKKESLEEFLQRETALYLTQMTDYFNMFVSLESRPIIAGLYFPMIGHFEKLLER
ncbi:UvrD-helicase domain-containing protein [Aliikangiella coralliicola]|uniref:DNA 3'-5' helicase n=1 Tax=Aliikangiella coralliicola TaxID=2592383 RepID=A0A545UAR5_9GAMM|nr:UvrD-helicase domain-containing protein [Aliikangiella coralliicola]TQV86523.1 AAA family ATPase [Aliikangiella coralliicola]